MIALFPGRAPILVHGVVNSQHMVFVNDRVEVLGFSGVLDGVAEADDVILPVAAQDPWTYYNTIETSISPAGARMQQQENIRNIQQDLQHE